MGIIASIRNHCFSDEEGSRLGYLNDNGKMISEDYEYFQSENWYRMTDNLLFDPNKFIFLYVNYQEEQVFLRDLWKIVDAKKLLIPAPPKNKHNNHEVISQRWKFAIRKGVPIFHYKSVIKMLFNKNSLKHQATSIEYENALNEQIKNHKMKIEMPALSDDNNDVIVAPFLNREGEEAVKRVAFLLAAKQGKLEKNPYFLTVISLLLIFLKEHEVYEIASTMVETSFNMAVQRQESLVWHVLLTTQHMQKFSYEFYKKIRAISPTINRINAHLNTEGIDKIKIFREVVGNFFFGYLPFPVILKTFIIYLNEGVQVFYRIYYAILKMTEMAIRDATSTKQILRILKSKLLNQLTNPLAMRKFFRWAFDLKLSPIIDLKKHEILSLTSKKSEETYYLPVIYGESSILSYQDLEVIWSFLPDVIKHYDIRRIFASEEDGGFKEMIQQLTAYDFMVVLIQTINDEVFGVFLAEKLMKQGEIQKLSRDKLCQSSPSGELLDNLHETRNQMLHSMKMERIYSNTASNGGKELHYFGSSESFIFILSPRKQKFSSTGENIFYCTYNDEFLGIGGPGNRPALQLDASLTLGLSFACPTYNNKPLHSGPPGQFRVKKIQCFNLQ